MQNYKIRTILFMFFSSCSWLLFISVMFLWYVVNSIYVLEFSLDIRVLCSPHLLWCFSNSSCYGCKFCYAFAFVLLVVHPIYHICFKFSICCYKASVYFHCSIILGVKLYGISVIYVLGLTNVAFQCAFFFWMPWPFVLTSFPFAILLLTYYL